MKLQSQHIFIKSILVTLIFCVVFWVAESIAQMFYFSEAFDHFLNNESLTFMDACMYKIPRYSLFVRLTCVIATLTIGAVVGILLQRDSRRTAELFTRERDYTANLEEAEKIAHVGHWEFNYKDKKTSWSQEIFNILQIPSSAKISDNQDTIMRFVHPEDQKQAQEIFLNSIKKQCDFEFSYRVLLEGDAIKYLSQRGHHVFAENGNIIRSFGTLQDVTSSNLATQALINSENLYRTLFDNVYQGIVIIEKESKKIKLANRVFCDLTGYTQKEIMFCSLQDLHPGENLKQDCEWTEVEGTPFLGNVECLRKDNSVFHAEVYASSIMLENQACIIAIFRDLTETHQVEYDRYKLNTAIDHADVEILICNPDGSIDYCSSALCRRLGYSSEEMTQMHIWDIEEIITEENMEMRFQDLRKAKTRKGEGVQIAKDGTRFEIKYVVDYVKLGNRELICGHIQDISAIKKRESILEEAKEKAEESDRLKSVFVANISHEIRTPMNGILGFADLLQREDLSLEKCQQYAKIIHGCGNDLMQLLDDILDISKIEAGEIKIQKEDFCINQVIENLYNLYEPQSKVNDKEISMQMHKSLRDDEAMIYSDKHYLNQILTNLVGNALKFTEKGEVIIGYNAKQDGVEFFVKDSGEGIAPELQDKIFEPFRQGEEILARKHHGTGLGLTIAKNYAELLGGYMRIESELGKGTTFYFNLPYSKNPQSKKEVSELTEEVDYNWKDKTFLIVEDNHISFMLLENLLDHTGVKVLHAETAQQSIDMTEANDDFDLILMDVRLPDFTGWEAAKIIKKTHPNLPILAQTANANAADKIKTFQAGCEAYLTKPIIKKEFYATINKCLTQASAK